MVTVLNQGDDNILGFANYYLTKQNYKKYVISILCTFIASSWKFDFSLTLYLSWCTALVIHSSGENPFKAKNDFHMRVYHSTKIPWFVADFFFRQSSWKMSFGDIKESWMLEQSLLVMMYILHLFDLQITVNKNKMDELSWMEKLSNNRCTITNILKTNIHASVFLFS